MTEKPRFGRRWRERKIEALEGQLSELHLDPTRPWDRYPVIPYEITWSEQYLKIHPAVVCHVGRSRQELLRTPGWEGYIHPDDQGRVDRVWKHYSLEGRPVEGLELRYRHAVSDRYVYLEDYFFPISWRRDGRPVRFSGWFENITLRKCAEIKFLLSCLEECSRPASREARREIVRRYGPKPAGSRLHLLDSHIPRRGRIRPPR